MYTLIGKRERRKGRTSVSEREPSARYLSDHIAVKEGAKNDTAGFRIPQEWAIAILKVPSALSDKNSQWA